MSPLFLSDGLKWSFQRKSIEKAEQREGTEKKTKDICNGEDTIFCRWLFDLCFVRCVVNANWFEWEINFVVVCLKNCSDFVGFIGFETILFDLGLNCDRSNRAVIIVHGSK